ncbi:MAG TPA: phosphoglucomutase/phosphomannomutase family protein [Caldilineaceae bacterium]|nr:phosphoglucomutase/phosphomannomutase family protein [Caldilineaceae bacterium]
MTIHFGTDGWRAVISDEFTFDNVRRVAQAIAEKTLADLAVARTNGPAPTFVVGFDTRFLSDRYAIAVAEVLAANGIRVLLAQADAPTPMISYAIVHHQAQGGVMITASHNPPRYNGIKLKAAYGGSASPAAAKAVEARLYANQAANTQPKRMELAEAQNQGLVQRFDPFPAYETHLRTLVDFDRIAAAKPSVAVDAMYGTGRVYLRRLLEDAGCTVTELRGEMNPGFNGIHPEPIARHLQPLMDLMKQGGYHIGLATDGDADRIGAVDPSGRFIDPHCIMTLLVEYLVNERKLRGSVVKTVSTTQMLNRLADRYGLTLHETPVGFNHISDLMLREPVLIGGEESGGISILGHIPEGDGILLGLLLVEMIAARQKSLVQLLDELMAAPDIGVFCYARLDQPVRPFKKSELVADLLKAAPPALAGVAVQQVSDRDGVKFILSDNSWLLIRPSGTEPVLRIYAESHSEAQVQQLLHEGAALAERLLGKPQFVHGD